MKAMTCSQADGLLELYILGECGDQEQGLSAHLGTCPACAAHLQHARHTLGLLDVHFGQAKGIQRLARSLRVEKKPQSHTLLFARRVGSMAAMLLVTFGLAALLPSVGPVPRDEEVVRFPGLFVQRQPPDHLPARGHEVPAPIVEMKAKQGQPLAVVELTNPLARPLRVQIGEGAFALRVEVHDAEMTRRKSSRALFAPEWRVVPAQGKTLLHLPRLAEQQGRHGTDLFVKPGNVRVTLLIRANGNDGERTRRYEWKIGPMLLQVP